MGALEVADDESGVFLYLKLTCPPVAGCCWFWIIWPLDIVAYLPLTNFQRTLRVLVTTLRVLDHWRALDNGQRLLVTTLRVSDHWAFGYCSVPYLNQFSKDPKGFGYKPKGFGSLAGWIMTEGFW